MLGYMIIGGIIAATVLPGVVTILVPHVANRIWRAVRPKVRGIIGEIKADRCLRRFKGKGFALAKDVMLPAKGNTTQVDNLLISPYGIFVIEVKNYSGIVLGQAQSPKWEQIVPGSKMKPRQFYNPIWQNNGHIKALRDLLGQSYPKLKYHNVVAFADGCESPDVPGVVKIGGLQAFLAEQMKGPPVLTPQEVTAIKEIIEKNNIKDRSKRTEHVEYAQYTGMMAKEKERKEELRKKAKETGELDLGSRMAYTRRPMTPQNFCTSLPGSLQKKPALSSQVQAASKIASRNSSENKAAVRETSRER